MNGIEHKAATGMRSFAHLLVAGTMSALLAFATVLVDRHISAEKRFELLDTLSTVLFNLQQSLSDWHDTQTGSASFIANRARVVELSRRLVAASKAGPGDANAKATIGNLNTRLGEELAPFLEASRYLGFELVTPDGRRVGAHRPEIVGRDTILMSQSRFIDRVLGGEASVSHPLISDYLLPNEAGQLAMATPVMYAGAPIFAPDGRPSAILALAIDPTREFSARLERGRIGQTGETYAFDRDGLLLSRSRYDDVLVELGMLPEDGANSILAVHVSDPLVNLESDPDDALPVGERPLTRMAAAAVQGASGSDLDGYRDYRGMPVVGVWTWLASMDLGIATEVDHDEAYTTLENTRLVLYALTGGGIALIATLSYLFHRGQRAALAHAEQLKVTALYDALTGLPNRRLFRHDLERALELARRHDYEMVLMFVDLDNFKRVNDSLGHDVGDQLLKDVGKRLTACLRHSDVVARDVRVQEDFVAGTVARLGGDEFTVVLSHIASGDDAVIVAERILRSLAQVVDLGGSEVVVSPSIGIAIGPRDGAHVDELIKHADTAMYEAKRGGKNRYAFFSRHMNEEANERLHTESRLRRAIEQDLLELHFQPLVSSRTNVVSSVEALVRWTDEELGPVSPGTFIPIAEQAGLIVPLGSWVLEAACRQARRWADSGIESLSVAVNVAAEQFTEENFPETVRGVLDRTGLDPALLTLELTERILMSDAEETIAMLDRLKAMGCKLAIDDFGTGYSSLAYLTRFPIDVLKIDRAFVTGLPDRSDNVGIVEAIIAMARSLDLTIVAECVETEDERAFLVNKGVHVLQGWLFSKALPHDECERWIRTSLEASTVSVGE
ncbi:MAG: putative bifunctional diguanylate cyclase/phosphodiesterase [Gammaproteobacteria bacterium]